MKLHRFAVICLLTLCVIHVSAQDKYEYGQVTYSNTPMGLAKYHITISTSSYQAIDDGKLEDANVLSNFVPVNKVLNDLADKGWEVYNTSCMGQGIYYYYYYIRKKK